MSARDPDELVDQLPESKSAVLAFRCSARGVREDIVLVLAKDLLDVRLERLEIEVRRD